LCQIDGWYPVTLPCPVLDLHRQNRKIGEFCELLIRDMTLTHVYHREKRLTILDDPAHLSPKPSHQSQPHTFPECAQVVRACCPLLPTNCPSCPQPRRQAGRQQTPGLHRRRCHPATATTPLLPPPHLVVNVKQANNEQRACAATVTIAMRPFVIASSVASPLVVDAKQADDECRVCAAAA